MEKVKITYVLLVSIDVVKEGSGWTYPPYSGHIENGNIYARGVLDNKGPIISALYGLYAIKEQALNYLIKKLE